MDSTTIALRQAEEVDKLVPLLADQAWKCLRKMGRHPVWDIEDLIQEAVLVAIEALKGRWGGWNPDKSSITTFVTTTAKFELAIRLDRAVREKTRKETNEPEDLPDESTPEPLKAGERVEGFEALSLRAKALLECIINPPNALAETIRVRERTGKPFCKSIKRPVLDYLDMGESEYTSLCRQIQNKAELVI